MTPKEREKLIEDMEIAILKEGVGTILNSTQLSRMARADIAIEAARIREDRANIINYENNKRYILASIPEKNDDSI